jgi:hypothetical protein
MGVVPADLPVSTLLALAADPAGFKARIERAREQTIQDKIDSAVDTLTDLLAQKGYAVATRRQGQCKPKSDQAVLHRRSEWAQILLLDQTW